MAYFTRTGNSTFRGTEHVGGAWNTAEQHVGPTIGLLAHHVETDRDRRRSDALVVARLSYDILGTIPMGADTEVTVEVVRSGRTVELVEATASHGSRADVRLRAWLMLPTETGNLAASPVPGLPAPEDLEPWDPTTVWTGGYIATAEVRRRQESPGRAAYWVRSRVPLLDEPVGALARVATLLDIANGMTVRADPTTVAFPNLDLTAHLFAQPRGEWVGFDTSVTFGAGGVGLTHSVLHDEHGPVGVMSQALTLRPA